MATVRTRLRRLLARLHLAAGAALVGVGHGFGQPTPGERGPTGVPAAGVAATTVVRRTGHVSGVLGRLLAALAVDGSVIRVRWRDDAAEDLGRPMPRERTHLRRLARAPTVR